MPGMRRNYSSKRRKTSRRSFKGSFRRKRAFSRYGDARSQGVKRYLAQPSVIRNPTWQGAFPAGIETTFTYCETVQITTTAGVNDFYVWSGNGIFDPNITGSGSQPFGFDQWTAVYNRYLVYGSQCTVEIAPTSSTQTLYTFKITLVPYPLASGLSTTSADVIAEMPFAKTKTGTIYTVGNGGNQLTSYATTAKVFGVSRQAIDSDDTYAAAVSANPSKQWSWWVHCNNLTDDGSTTYNVRIRIKYYAKMWQDVLSSGS